MSDGSTTLDRDPAETDDPHGPPWWIGLAVGGSIFLVGIIGFFENEAQVVPGSFIRFVVGPLIVHDAVLVPAVALGGYLLGRLLPVALRGGIQAALAVCGAVAIMSIPVLRQASLDTGEEASLLPQDYGPNLALVLGIVLVGGVLLTLALAVRRARRSADRRAG